MTASFKIFLIATQLDISKMCDQRNSLSRSSKVTCTHVTYSRQFRPFRGKKKTKHKIETIFYVVGEGHFHHKMSRSYGSQRFCGLCEFSEKKYFLTMTFYDLGDPKFELLAKFHIELMPYSARSDRFWALCSNFEVCFYHVLNR